MLEHVIFFLSEKSPVWENSLNLSMNDIVEYVHIPLSL